MMMLTTFWFFILISNTRSQAVQKTLRRSSLVYVGTETDLMSAVQLKDAYVILTSNITVTGASTGAGVLGIKVTATGVVIDGNGLYSVDGGGLCRCLWIQPGSSATLTNLVITNGTATTGGGIANGGSLTIVGCLISNCKSPSDNGGGINNYQAGATLTIKASVILNNSVVGSYGGGGISINAGNLTMSGSKIVNNSARGGGGMYIYGASHIVITSCIIEGNSAGADGGLPCSLAVLFFLLVRIIFVICVVQAAESLPAEVPSR